jgi:cytochrome c oxidase subunit 2
MNYILIAAAVLLLLIVGLIFRTVNLLDVVSGTFHKRAGFSNRVNAFLFPFVFVVGMIAAVWSSLDASVHFLPEASSVHGVRTDGLFWFSMGVIGIVFVASHILLFMFPFQYQYREDRKAYFFPENHTLELVWTVIPAIVLASLVFTGWKAWSDIMADAPANAYEIELTGKQFNWMARYPGKDGKVGRYNFRKIDATNEVGMDFTDKHNFDDFMANEVHLPLGKPVLLKIHARDVLHSVFLPHFRVKMDAVPGMPTRFWFIPTKTTAQMRSDLGNPNFNYELACTEICGRNHFGMRKVVVVDEEEDYLKWLNSQESFLSKNPTYINSVPDNLRAEAEKSIVKPAPAPAQAAL